MQEQEEEEGEEEIEREKGEGGFFQRYYKFSECSCLRLRSPRELNIKFDESFLTIVFWVLPGIFNSAVLYWFKWFGWTVFVIPVVLNCVDFFLVISLLLFSGELFLREFWCNAFACPVSNLSAWFACIITYVQGNGTCFPILCLFPKQPFPDAVCWYDFWTTDTSAVDNCWISFKCFIVASCVLPNLIASFSVNPFGLFSNSFWNSWIGVLAI